MFINIDKARLFSVWEERDRHNSDMICHAINQ